MISNILTILLESISFWICLHIVFKRKIKFNVWDFVYFIIYVTVFLAKTYKYIDDLAVSVFILFIIVWSKLNYNIKITKSIIGFIFAYSFCAILQLISGIIIQNVYVKCNNIYIFQIFTSILTLVVSIYIYFQFSQEDIIQIKYNKNVLLFFTTFLGVYFYIKIDIERIQAIDIVFYMSLFVIMFIVFNGMIKQQRYSYELEKKNLEIEMHTIYSKKYIDLVDKMKIKQHDYKNQLTVMQSMHLTAKTLEELIYMQNGFIDTIENEDKYDAILLGCSNPILAGYIYSRCLEYEKENIRFDVSVRLYDTNKIIAMYKVTEILGILLNNAYEKIIKSKELRMITLDVLQTEDKFIIEVSNPSEYIAFSQIEDMFKLGYSTKGVDRGIGLYAVKSIVNEHNGIINVSNFVADNINHFKIKISIPLVG